MSDKFNTEYKILQTACDIFLLFGYHGATLKQIAIQAGVNKSAVHYYFRSKEKLYISVVNKTLNTVFTIKDENIIGQKDFEKTTWFLATELYNNGSLFEKALKTLYPTDWVEKLNGIKKWLVRK
ncbi:MAG TPA: TetR/AcrR family transcriptional regulator [Williamwhitmania sp.]|nr:TetR/AcrR family transcriptional regulator [Williamwhitmania sp.]